MGRRFKSTLLLAGLILAFAAPGRAQDALLSKVEEALKATDRGAVHDVGGLLKPGGIRELQQLADRFQTQDKINVYFVTVPRGSENVDGVAEQAYQDLKGTPSDVLIVFDGKRVYGKALALKGDPQAFRQALERSRPGFKQYYAKGLAQFAQALRDRIVQRREGGRADAPPAAGGAGQGPDAVGPSAAAERTANPLGVMLVVLLALGGVGAGVAVIRQRAGGGPSYQDRLRTAEQVYDRVTLALPDPAPPELNSRWLALDERLRRARDPRTASLAGVVDLTDDLKAFERQVSERKES